MYRLLDLDASSSDPAGLKTSCQSFRFGTGTELSHLMRDRVEFWLKMGLHPLLSQLFYYVHQVIWSHGTPADLRWIIVNSKGNRGAHICGLLRWQEDTRTTGWEDGPCRLNWNSMKVDSEFSLPFMFLRYHQVDSFVCLASSSSSSSLPSSSPTSSLILLSPLFRMIMSPKNVFLQVFNTLVFEARSKWLLCLCFVVLNAGCIKSPPSPRPVCFIFSKTPSTYSRRKSCSALPRLSRDLAYLHRFLMQF